MLDVSGPISVALSLSPVPGLNLAFQALRHLWNAVQKVTDGRAQLNQLTLSVAEFLTILDQKSRSSPDVLASMQPGLKSLQNLLDEIVDFAEAQKKKKFLRLLFEGDKATKCVGAYENRLINCCNAFNISAHIDTGRWQSELEVARRTDQQAIEELLGQLMSNNDSLFANLFGQLDVQQHRLVSAMTAMQKAIDRLGNNQEHAAERRFYEHSVSLLQRRSGDFTPAEPWTISVFEIEKGEKIGSGGFSTVFRGTFLGTPVAIKELATQTSAKQMKREIAVWKDLAHPHIIQFIGAGCFEEPPFMVMPLMNNGNVLEFLHQKPGFNRYRLVHQVLLGLVFLHSRKVVHGDLKGANILIDSEEKAILSDFGLSAIKTDATSRSTTLMITGTRRWMSPERMRGRLLAPPADIYALAMTIYEVFTGLIPFGSADEGDLLALVLRENERPERPSDPPHLSDSIWNLIESAWVSDPQKRPTASDLERSVFAVLPSESQMQSNQTTLYLPANGQSNQATLSPPAKVQSNQATFSLPANVLPRRNIISWNSHMKLGHRRFTLHHNQVICVAFSLDGTKLVSGSTDGLIRIWKLANPTSSVPQQPAAVPEAGRKMQSIISAFNAFFNPKPSPADALLTGHQGCIKSVAFSPDETRIVSSSADLTIRLWDTVTCKMLHIIPCHSGSATAVQFRLDGKQFFSVSSSNPSYSVWDVDTGNRLAIVAMKDARFHDVAFSRDGSRIVTFFLATVCVWDTSTGQAFFPPLSGHTEDVTCVAFSPDGTRVASGSTDLTVRVWDATLGVILLAAVIGDKVLAVSFSADGQQFISGAKNRVRIWEVETGRMIKHVYLGWDSIQCLAVSQEGSRIAAAGHDDFEGPISVWEVNTISVWKGKSN